MLIIFKTVRKYLQATWEAVPSYRTILYHWKTRKRGDHGGFGEGAGGVGARAGLGLGLEPGSRGWNWRSRCRGECGIPY